MAAHPDPAGRNLLHTPKGQALIARVRHIPIVETLGIRILHFEPGFCRAVVPHDRRYDGIFESYHGGLLMTVADSVACFAIMTQTGPDEPLTTTDMNIRFLAACLTDVTAEAKVIKLGKTLCPVAVDLFDAAGVKVAVAQVAYMRLASPPKRGDRAGS
jgi:uncharacterized protein (TIGR00369 family)